MGDFMIRGLGRVMLVTSFACIAAISQAATIQLNDPATGQPSGWQASFPDSQMVSLVVDAVTANAVFIEKFVDFESPPGPGGVFPAVNITFTQNRPDSQTVPAIVINDEALTNLTGSPWGGFDWLVIDGLGGNEAWFNVPNSSDFMTNPFATQTFGGFVGGDTNRATTFSTTGGVVPHLGAFFPGKGPGELWMDIDLSQASITSFVLKELPTPEPGTVALLLVGAGLLARRRARD